MDQSSKPNFDGLRDARSGFDSLQGKRFSLLHSAQTDSWAHPASNPVGAGGSFPGSKTAGEWSWPLTSV
jgi:hypothetical protein